MSWMRPGCGPLLRVSCMRPARSCACSARVAHLQHAGPLGTVGGPALAHQLAHLPRGVTWPTEGPPHAHELHHPPRSAPKSRAIAATHAQPMQPTPGPSTGPAHASSPRFHCPPRPQHPGAPRAAPWSLSRTRPRNPAATLSRRAAHGEQRRRAGLLCRRAAHEQRATRAAWTRRLARNQGDAPCMGVSCKHQGDAGVSCKHGRVVQARGRAARPRGGT